MSYQEMLRMHSYLYQRRYKDIPRDLTGLGLLEIHSSVPQRMNFLSGIVDAPAMRPVTRDEHLIRDSVGEPVRPEAFPNTGFLGNGIGGP